MIEVANKRGVEGVEGEDKGEDEGADGEGREARLSRVNTFKPHHTTIFKPPVRGVKGKGKIGI